MWKILFFLQIVYTQWLKIMEELSMPYTSLDANWVTVNGPSSCSEPFAPQNKYFQKWTRNLLDLTSYQPYNKLKFLFDVYTINTSGEIFAKFNGVEIMRVTLNPAQNFQHFCSSTSTYNDTYTQMSIEIPITIYVAVNTFYIQFPNAQFSLANFQLFIQRCPVLNCDTCNIDLKQYCLTCLPTYQLAGGQCICKFPLPYLQNGICVSNCGASQYPDQNHECQNYLTKTVILQKFSDLTFTTTDFLFLPDNYFTQSLKTITSISTINAAGPFQFNEGIQYTLNQPNNIYMISALIYWLGDISLQSKINLMIDDYYVGMVSDFYGTFVFPESGVISSIYNCVHVDFSKCIATRIVYTIEAPINILQFKGNFNTNSSKEAWAIRDLYIHIITVPILPLSCSGVTPFKYQDTCLATCPPYTTLIGSDCQDFYPESVYLIKAFYSTDYFDFFSSMGKQSYENENTIANYETYLFMWQNKNMFGGINFWQGKQFIKQFVNLPPHYQIKVMFSVISIDGSGSETFNFFFDNIQTALNINTLYSPTNTIGQNLFEYELTYSNLFAHSSSELQLLMECVQTTASSTNSCALYDYFVIIARCPYNCKVCSDYLSCTEYYPPYQSSCGYGYFYDTKILDCSKCPSGCLSCANSISCDICNPNYTMFAGKCYCSSSKSKISTEVCDNFHQNCITSTGKDEKSCQTCDSSSHKWLNINECQCLRGFYMDQDYMCLPCGKTCETCDGQAQKCLSCLTTQFRYLNYGECDCWIGYYQVGLDEICLKCDDYCETCFISAPNCATCYPEHNRKILNNKCYCQNGYYDDGTLICKACSETCLTCVAYSKCWACKPEQFRSLTIIGNKCLCQDSYYEITDTFICQPCHPSCKKCNNSPDINQCTSCPYLREASTSEMDTFQCKCQQGYYESDVDYICLDCLDLPDPPLYHYCYSLCGDGIIQWNEDCDDLNDFPRDGCNNCRFSDSACLEESCDSCRADKCASCTDGYYLGKDSICHVCDSSCITCVTTATNCILCAYPIEGSTECLICGFGYLMNSGTCDSICGDGLKIGTEECDDGNNRDGDGCSSTCTIEPGMVCKSSCEPINYATLFLTASSSDNLFNGLRHAKLYIDQPVQIVGNISDTFKFNIFNQSNISISIIDQTDYSQTYFKLVLEIEITFTDSIQNPILQLNVETQNIKNQDGESLAKSEYQVQLNDCQFYSSDIQNATQGLMNLSQYILFVMLGLAIVAFLFGGLDIFWNLLDTLQLLSYIKYFNIQYPYNVTFYLTLFGFAEFNFMQDFFDLEAILSKYVDTPDTDQKFLDEGYSSVFYVNSISVITVFCTTLGMYLLCHWIFYLLKQIAKYIISRQINDEEEEGILFYFLMKITKNLEIYFFRISAEFKSGLLRTFMAVAFDLNIAIFLQLKDFNIHSVILFSSGIVTLFVLIFQIYFVYQGFIIMSRPHYYYKLQQTEFTYGALYEGVRIGKNPFTYYFNLIILIKKMLFMFFLVILYNVPIYQIGFVSILNIFIVAYTVLTKPLEDQSEYIKLLIGETLIWLIELIALFYAYNEQTHIFDNDQQLLLGWFIIALCSLIIIIQLIIDVKQHASYLMKEYAVLRNFIRSLQNIFNQQYKPDEQERLFSKQQGRHTVPGSRMKSRSSNKFKKVVTFSVSSSNNS